MVGKDIPHGFPAFFPNKLLLANFARKIADIFEPRI
jgi:hypothetical protein